MITLLNMIETWIRNDTVISKHFGVHGDYVYCKCCQIFDGSETNGVVNRNKTIRIEDNIRKAEKTWHEPKHNLYTGVLVCKITADSVIMQHDTMHEPISVSSPFSMYQIKAYMFLIHNKLTMACDEHLYQK